MTKNHLTSIFIIYLTSDVYILHGAGRNNYLRKDRYNNRLVPLSSMSTQFVKSPPTPADSKLWMIGKKWRRSQRTGLDYTDLDEISTTHQDIDIASLIDALHKQLSGNLKQSIDYVDHRIVASYSENGKALVYGYPPEREADAEKKASYNNDTVPAAGAVKQPQQQQTTFKTQSEPQTQ